MLCQVWILNYCFFDFVLFYFIFIIRLYKITTLQYRIFLFEFSILVLDRVYKTYIVVYGVSDMDFELYIFDF